MIDGTPHIMIWPNLFIAEIQIFVIQPLAVDQTVQHVTALQFKGAPDLNRRLRQQTMGSVGTGRLPAGRRRRDVRAHADGCADGQQPRVAVPGPWQATANAATSTASAIGDNTDETPSRGIWRHYRAMMEAIVMAMTPQQRATLEEVTQFIYREARLQDEHAYDAWEACGPMTASTGCPPTATTSTPSSRCPSSTTTARASPCASASTTPASASARRRSRACAAWSPTSRS
jgi:hypothetical protein